MQEPCLTTLLQAGEHLNVQRTLGDGIPRKTVKAGRGLGTRRLCDCGGAKSARLGIGSKKDDTRIR
jgi:hypothetical protein